MSSDIPAQHDFVNFGEVQELPAMAYLHIDSCNRMFTFHLLKKLRMINLSELLVSNLAEDAGPLDMYGFERLLPGLQRISILDVHQNVPFLQRYLNGNRSTQYPRFGLQLHVASQPRHPYEPEEDPKNYYAKLLMAKIFGPVLLDGIDDWEFPPFGDEVRHICLSAQNASCLNAAELDEETSGFTNLRVLIIRPVLTFGHGFWEPTLEARPFISGRLELPIQVPGVMCVEARAHARLLAKQNFPSLRFIVIHNEYFWVERRAGRNGEVRTQVWVRILAFIKGSRRLRKRHGRSLYHFQL